MGEPVINPDAICQEALQAKLNMYQAKEHFERASNTNCHGIEVSVYGSANAVNASVNNGSGIAIRACTSGTGSIGGFFESNGGYAIKTIAGKVVFNGNVGIAVD
ncbi:MAG: hypothetical protein N2053_02270, partial [Chitinispirillaceae bacterium]|nr:hypothetical protein [Chitinispirillaceae bacterium]